MNQTQPDTVKHSEQGNTSYSCSRSRTWCFTLNNYENNDITFFTDTLNTEKYVFQEECGENNTPHLQGVVYFKNARTFNQMKQLHSKVHWEITKSFKHSVNYCSDITKRKGRLFTNDVNIPQPLKLICNENNLFTYQRELYNMLKDEPDDRSIIWCWEEDGNVGKTQFLKFILHIFKDFSYLCTGGKANDITSQILKMKFDPKIFVMDLPRTTEGKVSYNGIEQVKNGLVSSAKYEGGFRLFNSPHVLILANFPPDIEKLSYDRWKIYKIVNLQLIPN